jgi:hypothetical protein
MLLLSNAGGRVGGVKLAKKLQISRGEISWINNEAAHEKHKDTDNFLCHGRR